MLAMTARPVDPWALPVAVGLALAVAAVAVAVILGGLVWQESRSLRRSRSSDLRRRLSARYRGTATGVRRGSGRFPGAGKH
jgi:hypothetical protein